MSGSSAICQSHGSQLVCFSSCFRLRGKNKAGKYSRCAMSRSCDNDDDRGNSVAFYCFSFAFAFGSKVPLSYACCPRGILSFFLCPVLLNFRGFVSRREGKINTICLHQIIKDFLIGSLCAGYMRQFVASFCVRHHELAYSIQHII